MNVIDSWLKIVKLAVLCHILIVYVLCNVQLLDASSQLSSNTSQFLSIILLPFCFNITEFQTFFYFSQVFQFLSVEKLVESVSINCPTLDHRGALFVKQLLSSNAGGYYTFSLSGTPVNFHITWKQLGNGFSKANKMPTWVFTPPASNEMNY